MKISKQLFFVQYCIFKGLQKKYAYGKVEFGEKPKIVFMDGTTSENIEYKGEQVIDGKLYRVSPATCGHGKDEGHEESDGSCEVGQPKTKCVERKIYSPNKCAVYCLYDVDIETFLFNLKLEEFQEIDKLCQEENKNTYQYKIVSNLSGKQTELLRMFITELGKTFDDLERVAPISIWDVFCININLAQKSDDGEYVAFDKVQELFGKALEIWNKTPTIGNNMGADFMYWYAVEVMGVNYVSHVKDYTNITSTKGEQYWKDIESAMDTAKEKVQFTLV